MVHWNNLSKVTHCGFLHPRRSFARSCHWFSQQFVVLRRSSLRSCRFLWVFKILSYVLSELVQSAILNRNGVGSGVYKVRLRLEIELRQRYMLWNYGSKTLETKDVEAVDLHHLKLQDDNINIRLRLALEYVGALRIVFWPQVSSCVDVGNWTQQWYMLADAQKRSARSLTYPWPFCGIP